MFHKKKQYVSILIPAFIICTTSLLFSDNELKNNSACADLAVLSFELSGQNTIAHNEEIGSRMTLVVINIGDLPSEETVVNFYLSEDEDITTNDLMLGNGEAMVPPMNPNESYEIDIEEDISIPEEYDEGPGYLGLLVDVPDLVAECDEIINNRAHIPIYATACITKSLLITDDYSVPVPNKTFSLSYVRNDPPTLTEVPIGDFTTDDNARISLCLYIGDSIKVSKFLFKRDSQKHPHFQPTSLCSLFVDNADFVSTNGAMIYDEINSDVEQEIRLRHGTVVHDFSVTVQWDASISYLDRLANGLRSASNYLYDVTDGQSRFGNISIYDNKENWNRADMRIYLNNQVTPNAWVRGWDYYSSGTCIKVPIKWFGSRDDSRNFGAWEFPLDMEDPDDFRTKIHECGHYFFNFYDEYKGPNGSVSHTPVHGFMELQYVPNGERGTEMSRSYFEYLTSAGQNTDQWRKRRKGCSDQFHSAWDKVYGGIDVNITMPYDYPSSNLDGPNGSMPALNYNTGDVIKITVHNHEVSAFSPLAIITTDQCGPGTSEPAPRAEVWLRKSGMSRPGIHHGRTANDGLIRIRGYEDGDQIRISFRGTVTCPTKSDNKFIDPGFNWFFESGPAVDSAGMLWISLDAIEGTYPFIHEIVFNAAGLGFNLYVENHPMNAPTFEIAPDDNPQVDYYQLTQYGDTYNSTISDFPDETGWLTVSSTDAVGTLYTIFNQYICYLIEGEEPGYLVTGPGGGSVLMLDSANGISRNMVILTSGYPPIRNGIEPTALQAGEVVSWIFEDYDPLLGTDNMLTIMYSNSELGDESKNSVLALSLRMFKWDDYEASWEMLNSSVDTITQQVHATISEPGVYALFTSSSCCNLPGDANADDIVGISDLTYFVTYMFDNGDAPVCYEEFDNNGDCFLGISDLTYFVDYMFNNGPLPVDCHLCK